MVEKEMRLNRVVAMLLRMGVLASVVCVGIGVVISSLTQTLAMPDMGLLSGEGILLGQLLVDVWQCKAQGFIGLGVVLMLLTPILRLVVALIGYIAERDRLYAVLCLLVLAVIALTFLLKR